MTSGVDQWNQRVIDEFHANKGEVSGPFQPVLLLTHTGRKSGQQRVNPLVYMEDGDRHVIFGSKGGFATHPDWYLNLVANPNVTVEVGTDKFDAIATEVTGEERDHLYETHAAVHTEFQGYAEKTTRKIPVIALTRK